MAAYGTDQGLTDWGAANGYTLTGSITNTVLRERGSAYVDALYGPRFIGKPVAWDQDRAWPRTGASVWGLAIPEDETPQAVINASYAAAFAEDGSPGLLSVTHTPGKAKVLTKVGSLSWTPVQGNGSAASAWMPVLTVADGLLAPFLIGGLHGNGVAAMVV
ncbi:hypothetical protein C4N9_20885 [Pararhodobacter marinus]|uniref:Putative DnaT-like domain-containing protein n=1 Tax=Pararhodobacter marinus TaxID=2184063 RepID=A0A2U2C4C8_9RHOB|nr:DnaT-like ssDNA-binding protein [Pararhodobacter marinus]PWE26717.1 hypothetical protein C4N9_20885 [Pararhodobacter marinus]